MIKMRQLKKNGKKKEIATSLDVKIKECNLQLYGAKQHLMACVEAIIVANSVINLYPEGADKNAAIKNAEAKKHLLLVAIGYYDGLMRTYNELLHKEEKREVTANWINNFGTSHQIVEIAYRNFWKR